MACWLLGALIGIYRRWLSGRGPLRKVTCSFVNAESCSAYGLRIVESDATSGLRAVALIRRRIRLCGEASLYRLPAGGLGWGELYERTSAALERELSEAQELAASRALVLRSRALVARECGERDLASDALARAGVLSATRSQPIVRDAASICAGRRKLLALRAVCTAALGLGALLLASLFGRWWVTVGSGLLVAALLWWTARAVARHLALAARLQRQELLARFTAPEVVLSWQTGAAARAFSRRRTRS